MKQEVLNSDVKDFLKTELISAVQNAMESLVNIVKAVITKDFCRATDRVMGLNQIPCWVKSMMAQKVCLHCQWQVINLKCMVKEKKEPM